MSELTWIVISALSGAVLGLIYFGGLWWTVQRTAKNNRSPRALILGSFLGRTALTVAGFYLLARSGLWQGVAAGLAGFVAARLVIVRRLRSAPGEKRPG